jgi:lysine 2,3-aminomutase
LPEKITPNEEKYEHIRTRDTFIQDVLEGMELAPMSVRLPPHILACIDWSNPLEDPLRRQFIPLKAAFEPDHPNCSSDPLHEKEDYPVESLGLVHRYPDKVLFLGEFITPLINIAQHQVLTFKNAALTHCPLYCRFCTRAHNVGADTFTVTKYPLKPTLKRWNEMLDYIRRTPSVKDVVVSGGDCYSLLPDHLALIGNALLSIPNVQRFRIASKGLCGAPSRILDIADGWTEELIKLSAKARKMGKSVALHTHFNHPNEFTWVSREAAQRLYEKGVTVRNQSVLLKGVNDSVKTMGKLIRELADNNIQPVWNLLSPNLPSPP